MIKLYSTDEAAALLGVKRRTVWGYVQKGLLQGRKIGKAYKFTDEELTEFMQRGTAPIRKRADGTGGENRGTSAKSY